MSARVFQRVVASFPRSLSANGTLSSRVALNSASRHPISAIRTFSSSSRSQATYVQFGGKRRSSYIPGRDPKEWYIIGALGAAGGVYYYTHLEDVPETGRTRFMNVTSKREKQLAKEMSRVIMQEYGNKMLPANHPVTQHVTDIVRRIVTSSGLGTIHGDPVHAASVGSDFNDGLQDHHDPRLRVDVGAQPDSPAAKTQEWTVYVVQDAIPNAFTTFGGYVVVFTGILPVAANDDGLAAVVAHELAHVVARHPSEQLSGQSILTGIAWVAEVFGIAPMFFTNALSQLLLKLPNSRTQEYEADQIGLKLMARACFDPREAQQMFRRLHEASGSGGKFTEFISTHPYGPKRVEALEVQMAAAYDARSENAACSDMQGLRGALNKFVGGGHRRPPPPEQARPLPPPRTSSETWREGDSSEFVQEGRSDGGGAWR